MAPRRGPQPTSTQSPPPGRDHGGQKARTEAEGAKAGQAVAKATTEGLAATERAARAAGNKA